MNILILANKLPYPPRDGGSIATLSMLSGLRDAGNIITCLALNTSKHPYPVNNIPAELRESIRFLDVYCDSSIRPLRLFINFLFSRNPYIAQRFNIKAYRAALTSLLQQESFDIIQLEGPYPGQYLDVIRKKSNARISLRAHNVEYLIWKRKAENEPSFLNRWYLGNLSQRLKQFELNLARQVDMLVPISEHDETIFREQRIQKSTRVIPAGLNIEQYPLTGLPAEPSIFFIGALDWIPNQEGLNWFLNNVLEKVLSKVPEIMFHVAGRNAPAGFEKKLIHPNICYHGEVSDALAFIQSHSIMVAPLLSGSGIRIKILEGMALGRPVVTTSSGIEGIPARKNHEVIVEDDPYKFGNQIIRLLKDPEKCLPMLKGARTLIAEKFDTFELSRQLTQFYIAGE